MTAQGTAVGRCYWHSLVEPVGNCAVCGRAGCGTCLVQETGGFRCQECARKRRQIVQPTPIQPQPSPFQPRPAPLGLSTPAAPLAPVPMRQQPSQAPSPGRFFPTDPKILVSLAVFLAGVAMPFLVGFPEGAPEPTWSDHLALGYGFWALFWGAPAAWKLWRKIPFHMPRRIFSLTGVIWITISCYLLLLGGWFYCLFGGGIYQFLKHWWSVGPRTA